MSFGQFGVAGITGKADVIVNGASVSLCFESIGRNINVVAASGHLAVKIQSAFLAALYKGDVMPGAYRSSPFSSLNASLVAVVGGEYGVVGAIGFVEYTPLSIAGQVVAVTEAIQPLTVGATAPGDATYAVFTVKHTDGVVG